MEHADSRGECAERQERNVLVVATGRFNRTNRKNVGIIKLSQSVASHFIVLLDENRGGGKRGG